MKATFAGKKTDSVRSRLLPPSILVTGPEEIYSVAMTNYNDKVELSVA